MYLNASPGGNRNQREQWNALLSADCANWNTSNPAFGVFDQPSSYPISIPTIKAHHSWLQHPSPIYNHTMPIEQTSQFYSPMQTLPPISSIYPIPTDCFSTPLTISTQPVSMIEINKFIPPTPQYIDSQFDPYQQHMPQTFMTNNLFGGDASSMDSMVSPLNSLPSWTSTTATFAPISSSIEASESESSLPSSVALFPDSHLLPPSLESSPQIQKAPRKYRKCITRAEKADLLTFVRESDLKLKPAYAVKEIHKRQEEAGREPTRATQIKSALIAIKKSNQKSLKNQ